MRVKGSIFFLKEENSPFWDKNKDKFTIIWEIIIRFKITFYVIILAYGVIN